MPTAHGVKEHWKSYICESCVNNGGRECKARRKHLVMRSGKTLRDHKSGAWGNRFANRQERNAPTQTKGNR